jgi:LacI family transcriptional regulator
MATIKEVARQANVSVGTVSNVLSGAVPVSSELRERVLAVVRELDYHPNHVARSLKIRQTKMLGMVVSDITNPFFPAMVRGAEDAAWMHHYMLITLNTDDQLDRERQVLAALRTRRVDGILLVLASTEGSVDHLQGAVDAGIPIVCVDRRPKMIQLDSVTVDNVAGARQCVAHLISGGNRRIAILTGPAHVEVARERLEGYREALEAAGIPYNEGLVRDGGFRLESGYAAAMNLLAEDRPEAFFCSNAMMAAGLLRALNERGLRCPDDVAVATFDDPQFAEAIRPRLTAMAQPAYEMGYQAAELLLRRIQDPTREHTPIVLKTELRIRESSARPNHDRKEAGISA